jgi:hypothetical protein
MTGSIYWRRHGPLRRGLPISLNGHARENSGPFEELYEA